MIIKDKIIEDKLINGKTIPFRTIRIIRVILGLLRVNS